MKEVGVGPEPTDEFGAHLFLLRVLELKENQCLMIL